MSAPTTNVEKQKRRHSGVLRGMAIVTGAVAVMFAVFYYMATDDEAESDAVTAPAAVEEAG